LHDPFYLAANYTRDDLLFSARGFVSAPGRTIARMDKLKLAKAISTQAMIVSQWASGSRNQFHRANIRAKL
jgi:hypothetical protein